MSSQEPGLGGAVIQAVCGYLRPYEWVSATETADSGCEIHTSVWDRLLTAGWYDDDDDDDDDDSDSDSDSERAEVTNYLPIYLYTYLHTYLLTYLPTSLSIAQVQQAIGDDERIELHDVTDDVDQFYRRCVSVSLSAVYSV